MAFTGIPTLHEDEPNLCSKLLGAIVKFWSMILRDHSWTVTFDPSKIPSEPLASPHSPLDDESRWEVNHSQVSPGRDRRQSVFATLSLGGELDRLLYWSAGFADEDLDRLTRAGRQNEIGSAVLECLACIAETLGDQYRPLEPDLKRAKESKGATLAALAKLAGARIASIKSDDDVMYDDDEYSDSGRSYASDSTMVDGKEEMLFIPLRLYIDRLQGLTKSIHSALADMPYK